VEVSVPQPPLIRFTVDKTHLKQGQSTTMRWNVTGATGIILDINGDKSAVSASGTLLVQPTSTAYYGMGASGPGGTSYSDVIAIEVEGPKSGELIWTGIVYKSLSLDIDHDRADFGSVEGSLPHLPCKIWEEHEKKFKIIYVTMPSTSDNDGGHLHVYIEGKGYTRVVFHWTLLH
jgi:hypothetical protein